MKKTIEVTHSRSFKANKGNFEQVSPMWSQKSIIEFNGETQDQIDEILSSEFSRIKNAVDEMAAKEWAKIKSEGNGLRIRIKDGKKYPSVTSILTPDGLPSQVSPEYGIRGTEIDRLFKEFVKTGIWGKPIEPLEKLKYEDIKYAEYFENLEGITDFKGCTTSGELFHDKHLYSGEYDIICNVNGIKTLADLKTGGWSWIQLVAYWHALNDETIEQLAIFDLKNQKLPLLNPNSSEAQEYWESFLIKRGELRARFGI